MLGIAGVFEIGMAYAGAEWHGLWGFTLFWIIANYIEAALMLPTIMKHLEPAQKFAPNPLPAE